MTNIYQIGPAVKLRKEVRALILNILQFKTEDEIKARYQIGSEILEACKLDREIVKQLHYLTSSYNETTEETSRILTSTIKELLDEYIENGLTIAK